jgi:hypothetical protein
MEFYRSLGSRCASPCRIAQAFDLAASSGRWAFVLEDLDQAGYSKRRQRLSATEISACLGWLASFHATFLGETPAGLWNEGSYWHLETRPDEWTLMPDGALKDHAHLLDERLRSARFRTLVHGDAKVANFCFPADPARPEVAAVDFQYVGGGVGVKDVAYFISSVLDERASEVEAPRLLDAYFGKLEAELARRAKQVDFSSLELEWRELYPVAWADFFRFLAGWAPGHAKMHRYSLRMTELALASIEQRG